MWKILTWFDRKDAQRVPNKVKTEGQTIWQFTVMATSTVLVVGIMFLGQVFLDLSPESAKNPSLNMKSCSHQTVMCVTPPVP